MITVSWSLASGEQGVVELEGDQKWTFGRTEADDDPFSVGTDNPNVSRTALVIRDSEPGPVVFRGQRENGSQVGVVLATGQTDWLDEGTAHNLSLDAHRIEFYSGGEIILTVNVTFDERPSIAERQRAAEA